jgi:hypothetical protein
MRARTTIFIGAMTALASTASLFAQTPGGGTDAAKAVQFGFAEPGVRRDG